MCVETDYKPSGGLPVRQVRLTSLSPISKRRIAVRASGSFNISTDNVTVQGISYKSCRKIQGTDGYNYYTERRTPIYPHLIEDGVFSAKS